MVGSAHRYAVGIGMGVVILIGLMLSKLSIPKQSLIFILLLIAFLKYSSYVVNIEGSLRHSNLVKPIYEKILDDTVHDPLPRALIVHTSRSNLVTGWLPYVYAYFKGLANYADFPTVLANGDGALEWICAPDAERASIAAKYAAPDYQKPRPISTSNVYAWSIDSAGAIFNNTNGFREQVSKCIK